jgi:hypothetical protein
VNNIVVMLCYARSGGTLLAKCIKRHEYVVLLSEVNPTACAGSRYPLDFAPLRQQARESYGIDLSPGSFSDAIGTLNVHAKSSNRRLFIRDWSFVDFVPVLENGFCPSMRLRLLDSVTSPVCFALVRDAIDVWISRNTPPADAFFRAYHDYIDCLLKTGIRLFKYEDFCASPERTLMEICEHVGLRYSRRMLSSKVTSVVTGDSATTSRGQLAHGIRSFKRKRISREKRAELAKCSPAQRVQALLGYPLSYRDREIETLYDLCGYRIRKAAHKMTHICEKRTGR